ncbi:hypothetical protein AO278_08165 [Pseudomonas syringae pv. syringae]|uniref:hypothetical protein n=1 Tax=Pseudomonas syringae TaxID=317 RepID=UPI000C12B3D2|nr:hypothetical protein [Pseudomonas syringae]PHX32569.1 hypothetical protein AO278_08165 [Pseudomonas syringae pv. syringae]
MSNAAPQPPSLGAEPEVHKHRLLTPARCHEPSSPTTYRSEWVDVVLLTDHRAHLAPLQAELDRQRGVEECYEHGLKAYEGANAGLREELTGLSKQFDELAAAVGFSKERCEQAGDSPLDCANQLRAQIDRQAAQFKDWQASHHSNYVAVAEERDQLKAENKRLDLLVAQYDHDHDQWDIERTMLKARNAELEALLLRALEGGDDGLGVDIYAALSKPAGSEQ